MNRIKWKWKELTLLVPATAAAMPMVMPERCPPNYICEKHPPSSHEHIESEPTTTSSVYQQRSVAVGTSTSSFTPFIQMSGQ